MFDENIKDILEKYDYPLIEDKIANEPSFPRDHSKLLRVNRQTAELSDFHFYDLTDLLTANDVLVLNETKVFSARLLGKNKVVAKLNYYLSNKSILIVLKLFPNQVLRWVRNYFFLVVIY